MKKERKDQTKKIQKMTPKDFKKIMDVVKRFPVKEVTHKEQKEAIWTLSE